MNVTTTSGGLHELPLFQCHKRVRACRISEIHYDDTAGFWIVTPAEPYLEPFRVPQSYVAKNAPKQGGYFVQYSDSYVSYSPPLAFEEGYEPVEGLQRRRHELQEELRNVEAALDAAQRGEAHEQED